MNDSIRILVVDDETSQRELVSGYLKKQGYQVVAAPGGQDALEIFRREPVELVLTDQRMPDLSGLDLLKAVRS
ncbi:MAG TPA: response regulator, partial [Phototrophicaceae bacterium]|nr:response regulator [Phototrophicaceae bacterium]